MPLPSLMVMLMVSLRPAFLSGSGQPIAAHIARQSPAAGACHAICALGGHDPNPEERLMPFDVYDLSIELVAQLTDTADRLQRRDRSLASQLRRAASSIALNLAEGRRRDGKDQTYHFRVAAGSAEETRAALQLAAAWRHLDAASVATPLATLDRVAAMLYRLTR